MQNILDFITRVCCYLIGLLHTMDEIEVKKIKELNSFLLKELSESKVRIKKLEEENEILKDELEKTKAENVNKNVELNVSSDSGVQTQQMKMESRKLIANHRFSKKNSRPNPLKNTIIITEDTLNPSDHVEKEIIEENKSNYHITSEEHLVSGIKNSKCNICGKKFGYNKSLKNHLKRRHGGIMNTMINTKNTFNPSNHAEIEKIEEHEPNYHEISNKNIIPGIKNYKFPKVVSDLEEQWQSPVWKHFTFIQKTKSCICNYCSKIMSSKFSYMHQHLKRFHDIEENVLPFDSQQTVIKNNHFKTLKCDKCEKMMNHTDKCPCDTTCSFCGKYFNGMHGKKSLKIHIKHVHERVRLQCDFCSKNYVDTSGLKYHMKKEHPNENLAYNYRRRCKNENVVNTKSESKIEIDSSENINDDTNDPKKYKCNDCDKEFPGSDTLIFHVLTVHEGRKNQLGKYCEFCGKSFSQSAHLKRHVSTVHEGNKQKNYNIKVICDSCGKSFAKGNLKTHVDAVHDGRKAHKYMW